MSKVNYLLIDASILPDVYKKVIEAKTLLLSGEAGSVSAAVKMAGISRSAYYKYKDKVFEYYENSDDSLTLSARLEDNAGVLSSVMNELYLAGANVLSVNQSVPVNGSAGVTITVRTTNLAVTSEELIEKIKRTDGVQSAEAVSNIKER